MAYMDTSADLSKFSPSPEAFLKRLSMCAAMWGCCYDETREFEMTWELDDNGAAKLVDVANAGIYSFYVEGLISRFLMYHTPAIDSSVLNHFTDVSAPDIAASSAGEDTVSRRYQILERSEWKPGLVSAQDWEDLRETLYAIFFQNGRGFFANDLRFADMAIDWLKSAKECVAGSCSKLLGDDPAPSTEEQFFANLQATISKLDDSNVK